MVDIRHFRTLFYRLNGEGVYEFLLLGKTNSRGERVKEMPGGKRLPSESDLQCLQRENLEETELREKDYVMQDRKYTRSFFVEGKPAALTVKPARLTNPDARVSVGNGDVHKIYEWLPGEEFRRKLTHPEQKSIYSEFRKDLEAGMFRESED